MIPLETPIQHITGIGPTYAAFLAKLNIFTVKDFIEHYPFRYNDFAQIKEISATQIDEEVTVVGTVWDIGNIHTKYGKILTRAVISDGSGTIEAVWFNQRYLLTSIKQGVKISLSGKIKQSGYKLQLQSPAYEILDKSETMINTGRLVPVYPETAGITSRWIRMKLAKILPDVLPSYHDWLPEEIVQEEHLLTLPTALRQIHFPNSKEEVLQARKRIAYDELLKVHLTGLKRKYEWQQRHITEQLTIDLTKIASFTKALPFALTNAQNRVIEEILSDMELTIPMNRLLEGDVGSGKTVVAAVAMYAAHLNGVQSALMAPTEILANQHFETLKRLLEPQGLTVGLVTGSTQRKKANLVSGILYLEENADEPASFRTKPRNPSSPDVDSLPRKDSGTMSGMTNGAVFKEDIVIGTHALVSASTQFRKLGLIVIDEQHKFGVEQRALLRAKGKVPHTLTMTATPIPRTLALTLYGNLDLSVINEMPKGRSQIKTRVIPAPKRHDAYRFIEQEIVGKGIQAFVVCPLIDESENFQSIKAASVEFDHLQKEIYPNLKIGLLHGRMKSKEKDTVMQAFQKKEFDILVATPLVEVGIDIPNATIMLIEASDRFGLAQLHQLRGRVGRRENQEAYCFLFTELHGDQTHKRLKAMEDVHSGAELAEIDLQYRGAGEIFGTAQHGIPQFKVAKLTNLKLIEATKIVASKVFSTCYLKNREPIKQFVDDLDKQLVESN